MGRKHFNVVIMHGNKDEYKIVKKIVVGLGFNAIVLKETFDGSLLLERVRNTVWKYAHCAVIVMSPDDITKDGKFRARQNVVFELGYCLASFDSIPDSFWYNAVIVLKEKSVESFSDIGGMQFIEYERSVSNNEKLILSEALNSAFSKARKYYPEL